MDVSDDSEALHSKYPKPFQEVYCYVRKTIVYLMFCAQNSSSFLSFVFFLGTKCAEQFGYVIVLLGCIHSKKKKKNDFC